MVGVHLNTEVHITMKQYLIITILSFNYSKHPNRTINQEAFKITINSNILSIHVIL